MESQGTNETLHVPWDDRFMAMPDECAYRVKTQPRAGEVALLDNARPARRLLWLLLGYCVFVHEVGALHCDLDVLAWHRDH